MWLNLTLNVNCTEWNGCVDSESLNETSVCYKILSPMPGDEAWKTCKSVNVWTPATVGTALAAALRQEKAAGGASWLAMWGGAIELEPGNMVYLHYGGRNFSMLPKSSGSHNHTLGCMALTLSPSNQWTAERRDCSERLHVLCETQSKYRAFVYNASAPEACDRKEAVSLLPNTGCYYPAVWCPRYSVRVRPEWYFQHLDNIPRNNYISAAMVEMNTVDGVFVKPNDTTTNTTNFCYVGKGADKTIQLILRRNKTAGALSLWVDNPGRAEWPPRCVGGHVQDRAGNPRALRVVPHGHAHALWCYTRDIITGAIFVSNRVPRIGEESTDYCPYKIRSEGPPPGTLVDHKASCVRCLEQDLELQFSEWNKIRHGVGGFEAFRRCAESRRCVGDVLWELTEGGDCDGDGVDDCDDRFMRRFQRDCDPSRAGPGGTPGGGLYWTCRADPRRDFVDVPAENGTSRYYCLNKWNERRHWSGPEYLPKNLSYFDPVDLPPLTTENPELLEKETTEELETLQLVTFSLPPNETLTEKQTEEIVNNFTRLFNISDKVLRKAQRDAKVSSLPELLETILIRAPVNVTFSTPTLAISKKQTIGFQLISEKPSHEVETFGKNPQQIPISSWSDIKKNKVEAAVILPNITKETTLVLVTFAKGSDFTSCRTQANTQINKTEVVANFNVSLDEEGPIRADALPEDTAEFSQTDKQAAESVEGCPYHKELVSGCINTHVVQVNLLNGTGSYVQLPHGESVDILMRTKITPMLGQTKTCAYWKPQEGWATDGCELVEEDGGLDVCRCTHLTHFAQLVTEGDAVIGPHKDVLNTLSMCACSVSLLGLFGVILAGILAKKWRKKTENKVMLNLTIAMTLYLALFLWSTLTPNRSTPTGRCAVQEKLDTLCQVRGAALHYCVLSSFCWMLVAAFTHHLRFTTLTGPAGVPRFVLKAAAVGWGAPALPVTVLMGVDPASYAGRGRDFCYPSGAAFYGAVLAPVLLVLLVNAVLFGLILHRLFPRCCHFARCCHSDDSPPPTRFGYNERRTYIRKMIVCVAFVFLFGLTWYLGLMTFTVVPAYIFCIVMALQGPALFIFFVLGEESIRKKLIGIKRGFGKSEPEMASGWTGSSTSTNVLSTTSSTIQRNRWRTPAVVFTVSASYNVNKADARKNQQRDTTM